MTRELAPSPPSLTHRDTSGKAHLNSSRVLFVDHTARMGGGEVALLHLARSLDRARYVPIVLLFSDGPLREKLDAEGVETRVLALDPRVGETRKDSLGAGVLKKLHLLAAMLGFVWRVRREIAEVRPAVVHTNSLKADIIGGLAGRLAGAPVLWHVRDRIDDDYLPRPAVRMFRRLARWLPRVVVANSDATLRTLRAPAAVAAARFRVVHDGTPPIDLRDRRRAPDDPLVVGLVGRITRWKGQHVFLEAARRVRARFPTARFQLIGSAMFGEEAYEREIRAQVARDGLGDAVEFTGFREDVADAIAGLDVLVHASITGEPFGQVIIEGMIAGKPVVATNGGGVPEIVVDGVTGTLVPMGDAPAMAAAIEALLGDAGLRERMGRAGRQRVLEHFTVQRTADRVMDVYDAMLQSAGAPEARIG